MTQNEVFTDIDEAWRFAMLRFNEGSKVTISRENKTIIVTWTVYLN